MQEGLVEYRVERDWSDQGEPVAVNIDTSYLTETAIIDIDETGFSVKVKDAPIGPAKFFWVAIW